MLAQSLKRMSPVMARVSGTYIWNIESTQVSPLIGKKVKPINNNAVRDHLLYCNYLLSFDNSSNLAHRNKKVFVRN